MKASIIESIYIIKIHIIREVCFVHTQRNNYGNLILIAHSLRSKDTILIGISKYEFNSLELKFILIKRLEITFHSVYILIDNTFTSTFSQAICWILVLIMCVDIKDDTKIFRSTIVE